MNETPQIGLEMVKGAPPVVVTATSFFGVSLPDLLYWLTILYTILLIVFLLNRERTTISSWTGRIVALGRKLVKLVTRR